MTKPKTRARKLTPAKAGAQLKRVRKTKAPAAPDPARELIAKYKIAAAGLYPRIAHLDYHHDPLPLPSCSASLLNLIDKSTVAHAWQNHPRLNPHFKPMKSTPEMDFGTGAHSMLLKSGSVLQLDRKFENWRSARAQFGRIYAAQQGGVALLAKEYAKAEAMAATVREGIGDWPEVGNVFDPKLKGVPEMTACWLEDGVWCRARSDWWIAPIGTDPRYRDGLIIDYKTTSGYASAEEWSRQLFNLGSNFQEVWYRNGFAMALRLPKLPRFAFIVQEIEPPFAFAVHMLSEVAQEWTTQKIVKNFHAWRTALTTDQWSAYPRHVSYADVPPWAITRDHRADLAALVAQRPL